MIGDWFKKQSNFHSKPLHIPKLFFQNVIFYHFPKMRTRFNGQDISLSPQFNNRDFSITIDVHHWTWKYIFVVANGHIYHCFINVHCDQILVYAFHWYRNTSSFPPLSIHKLSFNFQFSYFGSHISPMYNGSMCGKGTTKR